MNRYKGYKTIVAIAIFFFWTAGCTVSKFDEPDMPDTGKTKIINSEKTAVPGKLLLKLTEVGAEKVSAALSEDWTVDARLCGSNMDSVLNSMKVTSFERIFKSRDTAREREMHDYGLDRWYSISFPDDADLEKMAKAVSMLDEVEIVQYNTRMKMASDGVSLPYSPAARTSVSGNTPVFNDEMLYDQWNYENKGDQSISSSSLPGADINVRDAWRLTAGDPGIIVAILDEAVQWDHPDLEDNMWDDGKGNHGYNFPADSPDLKWDAYGDRGHGTHIAGTIAAVNNNGIGVCGIAGGTGHGDGVRIMSLQIMEVDESNIAGATDEDSAEAIYFAAENGADIIQCSWGYAVGEPFTSDNYFEYRSPNQLTAEAINYFVNRQDPEKVITDGGLAIFASGNEGQPLSAYPGAYADCISVTAIAADNRPAYYTNYGPGCNIAAPGGEDYSDGAISRSTQILSTMPTKSLPLVNDQGEDTGQMSAKDYGYMHGTSMACPHVSGVAALGLSYARKLGKHYTREQFTSLLLSSVSDIDRFCHGTRYTVTLDPTGMQNFGLVDLNKYRGQMGTGYIDAWKLLMNIEGTPYVIVKAGEEQSIPLNAFFGDGSDNLTYTDVTISAADEEAIGLFARPEIRNGKLVIFPLLTGSAKLTVTAVGGGDHLGGGDSMGGTEISREISVLVRNISSANGGWL